MSARLIILAALGIASSGCCSFGVCAKRESEANCPTDIRKTVPWCAGEDAVFHCPCGPEGNFYGHRPTCWRDWPTSASAWRDMSCGPTIVSDVATSAESNPFRGSQEIPTPAPEPAPAPVELPPLPRTIPNVTPPPSFKPPAATENIDAQGPPVLPPRTTAIMQPASQQLSATMPVAVPAPQNTKVKFVAPQHSLQTPGPPAFAPAHATSVEQATAEMGSEETITPAICVADDAADTQLCVLPPTDAESHAADVAPAEQRSNAPVGVASPTFKRPSIKVHLIR
jgi:hypothetical protein